MHLLFPLSYLSYMLDLLQKEGNIMKNNIYIQEKHKQVTAMTNEVKYT